MFCDARGSVFVWVVERATRPASKAMVFRSKDDDSMLEQTDAPKLCRRESFEAGTGTRLVTKNAIPAIPCPLCHHFTQPPDSRRDPSVHWIRNLWMGVGAPAELAASLTQPVLSPETARKKSPDQVGFRI